jgi:HlyD family secretion protein
VTREKSKRKWFYVILILLLLGAGAFYFWGWVDQNDPNQRYRMVRVERGDITSSVTATGTINPVVTVLVGSQVSGTIKALYADFNSRVKEGQVIAQIDPALFEAQVEQARANVLKAQAGVANAQATVQGARANLYKAEVAMADTKRTLDRNAPLAERKVVAQQVLDTAQANYDSAVAQRDALKAQLLVADAQVESEKANVENTKAGLRMAETNLRYTTIRSPVTGIVISRNVDVGQTVAASLQAPTLFTIAKDLTHSNEE